MNNRDRREQTAARLRADVDLRSASNFYSGAARDLSEGGLFVEGPISAPIGAKVVVSLILLGKEHRVEAEVSWILQDEHDNPLGAGVQLVRLPPATRKSIRRFMARREPMSFRLLESLAPSAGPLAAPVRVPPLAVPRLAVPPPLPWTPSCPPPAA